MHYLAYVIIPREDITDWENTIQYDDVENIVLEYIWPLNEQNKFTIPKYTMHDWGVLGGRWNDHLVEYATNNVIPLNRKFKLKNDEEFPHYLIEPDLTVIQKPLDYIWNNELQKCITPSNYENDYKNWIADIQRIIHKYATMPDEKYVLCVCDLHN